MLTLSDRVESSENYVLIQKSADLDMMTSVLNRRGGGSLVITMLEKNEKAHLLYWILIILSILMIPLVIKRATK